MGVKINLAKWSDALLETSNCFSLILQPPPHSLKAANDAVVGADVSPGEKGSWVLPPRGFSPSGAQLFPQSWPLSWPSHFLQCPHPYQAPHPRARSPLLFALCRPGTRPCTPITLHQERPVGNRSEGKVDSSSICPDSPNPFSSALRSPVS